ncbi:AMP-binding protein [Xanthobacter tagetidis]|uniref:Long-chain fatty acid--CoA ligase n=1 Tax=Xanthobacter tagetidis TaxID=60216 RepID=A0A3L7AJE6_9HYPH|nr:AMP-binding protein [Xanthobacter tagetidis]MBB6306469.1 long-chain acyl-CoA synthetase [Xanthobacter tagetidis]RLP79718.1 long-chain fatty acid--CoA ligase [Xanthobacter tagetidis]
MPAVTEEARLPDLSVRGAASDARAAPRDQATGSESDDTFPKVLLRRAKGHASDPAVREKEFGIWQSYSWSEVAEEAELLACGLASLGLERGDRVALLGANRPQFYWATYAIQSVGAIPVPIYQDSIAEEAVHILDHSGASFVLAEDQEQIDKVLSVRDHLPRLSGLIFKDPRGLRSYAEPGLRSMEEVRALGIAKRAADPSFFARAVAEGSGGDVAIICYTSGTTGKPKGVVLTFDNLIATASTMAAFEGLTGSDSVLAYLPMAWIGDHFFSYAQSALVGFPVNCPESGATLMTDLREVGPTYFFAPPRIFESILTDVTIRMENAGWIKRRLFAFFMAVARSTGVRLLEGRPVSAGQRLLYGIGRLVVYAPLLNTLGLRRLRVAYTAGEALGPEIFDFYRSLGVNLKQVYGQTESSVYVCVHANDDVRSDTVGRPAPGVEVRFSEQGELLYRSPGVFKEYYRTEDATGDAKDEGGWVRSGDAGIVTDDGHIKIIDRAKDVGRLLSGSLFAPKYIENKLKFFPSIKEAVAFGDGRQNVCAFINIELEAVGNWAERRGISFTSYADLAGRMEVYDLVSGQIEEANRSLARELQLAGAQIHRFLILPKELDADDGELTRTRKVRRRVIAERYGALIEAMYGDDDSVDFETRATFEDGRVGIVRAHVPIRQARTFAPEPVR